MRRFMLCIDPKRVPPDDEPSMAEVVWDALGEVIPANDDTMPSSEQVQSWTDEQLIEAYDWATFREQGAPMYPRPKFTYAWEEDDGVDGVKRIATTLYVAINVEHDEDADMAHILDRVLDNGDLQDALTAYADDYGHKIEITSCLEVDVSEQLHIGHKGSCGTVICRAMEDS
jgi:hypothetical protein